MIAACQSVDEAIAVLNDEEVDLLFLDVNLNGESGFDLLERAKGADFPSLIFTTAHDEFAIQAIKHAALDYLLKPIDAEDLVKAVQIIRSSFSRIKPQFWPQRR